MANDLRSQKIQMPVIPSSRIIRERLVEVLKQAEKLKILLRLAADLEQVDSEVKENGK